MDRSKRNQFATLALGALVAVAQPSFAREAGTTDSHEDRKEARGIHGGEFQGLNLTEAQKAQVKSIMAAARQQRDAVGDNKTLTEDQREAQLKTIRQSTSAQINSILTPDQQKKLAERREEKHEKGHGKGKLARLSKELNLSPAQKDRLKPIFQTQRQRADAIRDNKILTDDQREAQRKALRQSTNEEVNEVLTPEQRTKLQQIRADHREDRK